MVYEPKVYQPMELYVNLRSKKLRSIVWWSFDQNQGPHQAPEEFLAALAAEMEKHTSVRAMLV